MLSKRAITLCKIILQLMIITKKMYAIIGELRSGGLKSGGVLSCGLRSGWLMSGGLKSAHRIDDHHQSYVAAFTFTPQGSLS